MHGMAPRFPLGVGLLLIGAGALLRVTMTARRAGVLALAFIRPERPAPAVAVTPANQASAAGAAGR